jgi:hypothetical protein
MSCLGPQSSFFSFSLHLQSVTSLFLSIQSYSMHDASETLTGFLHYAYLGRVVLMYLAIAPTSFRHCH